MRSAAVRWLIVLLFACGAAFARQKHAGTAALSGVVKGADGAAVAIHLEAVSDNPTRYYDGYEATGAQDGRFKFEEINPGTYRLTAEASGLMPGEPGQGQEIVLRPHQRLGGVTINLIHRPVLSGRVTENGAPKTTWVHAYRYDSSHNALIDNFLPNTNDDGSFRFPDLQPGTYYVQGYVTWYPGSYSFNGAKPVTLGPGGPDVSLEIPLQYTGCRATKVSGRIEALPRNESGQYRVSFLERNANGGSVLAITGINDNTVHKAGDNFSATVCPGDYDVVLTDGTWLGQSPNFPSHRVVFDTLHVVVGAKQIEGLVLTPRPMATVEGEVHFEDITRRASCPGIGGQHVSILRESDGQYQSIELDDKNHFEFRNVAPGEYSIYLSLFSREAVYVRSLVVDGISAEGRRFSVKEAKPVAMEITLSGDLAHAAGHIPPDLRREHRWEVAWTRPKGSIAGKVEGSAEGGTTVKLISARYNSNASGEYTTHAAAGGGFRFDNVDPGVYTLRAEGADFATSEYGASEAGGHGTPIIVARGENLRGLRFAPPKLSAICGRVTDSKGALQAKLQIYIEKRLGGYLKGIKWTGKTLFTDDAGRFRADKLPPGDYFLSFLWQDHYGYFSPDGSPSAATPLHLQGGQAVGCGPASGMDFGVPSDFAGTHTIIGQVVGDLSAEIGDRFGVTLLWDVPGGQTFQAGGGAGGGESVVVTRVSLSQMPVAYAKLDAEHRFVLEKVPNGRFILQLHSAYGPEPKFWSGPYGPPSHLLAMEKIAVQGKDIRGLQIASLGLPRVTGTLHVTNLPAEWKNFDVSGYSISLVPRAYRAPLSAKLSKDGSFVLGRLDVGDYEVQIHWPAPFYIRSVRLDGQEIRGRTFNLPQEPQARLEVEVSGDGAEVNVDVRPDPSLPLPEPPVREPCGYPGSVVLHGLPLGWPEQQVILFPDPLFPGEPGSASSIAPMLYLGYRVGKDGREWLQATAVPPGRYRVVVAEHLTEPPYLMVSNGLSDDERKLWSAVAALGQPVTAEPGAKIEIELTDKTVDVARLAVKFGVQMDEGLLRVR